jgi:hypothetical protein
VDDDFLFGGGDLFGGDDLFGGESCLLAIKLNFLSLFTALSGVNLEEVEEQRLLDLLS